MWRRFQLTENGHDDEDDFSPEIFFAVRHNYAQNESEKKNSSTDQWNYGKALWNLQVFVFCVFVKLNVGRFATKRPFSLVCLVVGLFREWFLFSKMKMQ